MALLEVNQSVTHCWVFNTSPYGTLDVFFLFKYSETTNFFSGFGKFNIFLILVCGLVMFSSMSESYSVGYTIPVSECELNLDSYTKGILSSTNLIGTMSSCAIWGYLSDYKGRKNLILINLILAFVTGFLSVFISSFWGFCVVRILNGIW